MALGMLEPMARPKKKPAKADPKRSVVSVRGSDEWRDWLMELSAFRRLKATDVIDQALVEYAEKYGFKKPAPPR